MTHNTSSKIKFAQNKRHSEWHIHPSPPFRFHDLYSLKVISKLQQHTFNELFFTDSPNLTRIWIVMKKVTFMNHNLCQWHYVVSFNTKTLDVSAGLRCVNQKSSTLKNAFETSIKLFSSHRIYFPDFIRSEELSFGPLTQF